MGDFMHPDHLEAALRLAAATGLGAVVGLQRELAGRAAGLRTHLLVAIGACLFTLAGSMPFLGQAPADPTRVASQVVVGIGFLGGGSILRHGTHILGLTTAANLWVMAAIGLTCGLGLYLEAAFATLLVLGVLLLLKPLEVRLMRARRLKPPDADAEEVEQ